MARTWKAWLAAAALVALAPPVESNHVSFDCANAKAWTRNTIGVVEPGADVAYDFEQFTSTPLPVLPATGNPQPAVTATYVTLVSNDADLYILRSDCQTVLCESTIHPPPEVDLGNPVGVWDECALGDASHPGFAIVRHHGPAGQAVQFYLHWCEFGGIHLLPQIFQGFCPI